MVSTNRVSRALSARIWTLACILKALGRPWRVKQGSDLVRTVFWMAIRQPCGRGFAQAGGRNRGRGREEGEEARAALWGREREKRWPPEDSQM